MVQEMEKYIKLHVLGDFGDIWIGISDDSCLPSIALATSIRKLTCVK